MCVRSQQCVCTRVEFVVHAATLQLALHACSLARARSFLERVTLHITKNYLIDAGAFDSQTRVPLLLGIWVRVAVGGQAIRTGPAARSEWHRAGAGLELARASTLMFCAQGGKGQGKTFQTELAFKKLG